MQDAKSKMFSNKKAINDISIILIIVFIFLGTATVIPFIDDAFRTETDEFNTENLELGVLDETKELAQRIANTTPVKVFLNMLKLAFFDFGNTLGLPFWLDIIYTILAIIFVLVILRNVWVGGGG